jgi:hypothetical protein
MLIGVQCDEIRPACGNCVKHKVMCDFLPTTDFKTPRGLDPVKIPVLRSKYLTKLDPFDSQTSTSSSALAPSLSSASLVHLPAPNSSQSRYKGNMRAAPNPLPSIDTPTDRLFELRLFNHYIQLTSHDCSGLEPPDWRKSNIWAAWMAGLAPTDQTLMDALLGFSAFHLQAHSTPDPKINKASHVYMSRAIRGHAVQLRQGVKADNVEVMFATSTFVAFYSSMNLRFVEENDAPPLHVSSSSFKMIWGDVTRKSSMTRYSKRSQIIFQKAF